MHNIADAIVEVIDRHRYRVWFDDASFDVVANSPRAAFIIANEARQR